MNNNIKNTFRTGILVATGLVALYSCSDTWDEHYNAEAVSTSAFNGTTMQAIEQTAPQFAEVIRATGFDRELASSNTYTIWVPADGTYNRDSLLAVAQTDPSSVIKRFLQNHVARYSIPMGLSNQEVALLNTKLLTMTGKEEHKMGSANIINGNVRCNNGLIHFIDGELPYMNNIFELIEQEYNRSTNASKADSSLYAFLSVFNKDSLLEDKSVSRGVDENGEKIWVDSVTLRNNTALKNVDALVYDEDSNYIALIPTVEAFQKRYSEAKSLLKFNPHMDSGLTFSKTDSLQNYYANMFSMNDLFYNRSANEHWEDSLKSTVYTSMSWPYGLYYRRTDNLHHDMPEDKEVNDILATVGLADSIVCSNGIAYLIDEYPMDITEQYFKKLKVSASAITLDTESKAGTSLITKNIGSPSDQRGTWTTSRYRLENPVKNEAGDTISWDTIRSAAVTQSFSYLDVPPSSSNVNPNMAFKIFGNLSGEYDIYIVTTRYWFKNMTASNRDLRSYRFNAYIWEQGDDGAYPKSGKQMINPADGLKYYVTPTPEADDIYTIADTTYLGAYAFKYAYYAQDEPGVLIQINTNISSSLTSQHSREMLISGFILKPHKEIVAPENKKRNINTNKPY